MFKISRGNTPEKIYQFLKERTPSPFCDDCITKGAEITLSARQQVTVITRALGLTTDFDRAKGPACSDCGKSSNDVTRSLRYAKAAEARSVGPQGLGNATDP